MNSSKCRSCFGYSRLPLSAIAALSGLFGGGATAPAEEISVPVCIVVLIDDVTLAAQEDGLLFDVAVREGADVSIGQTLAKFDDRQAKVQLAIARGQHEVAKKKAENDVDLRLAQAESLVKKFEHEQAVAANKTVPDVVGRVEMRRMELAHQEASLKAEKAEYDLAVLDREKSVRELEVEAARLGVERRAISSPIDGVVVQRFADVGEWVKIGDPVVRVVRLDKLWVEGLIESRLYESVGAAEKTVEVLVRLDENRSETFSGRIVFVDPLIDGNGRFRVRAEVANRRKGDNWLLLPGHVAEMRIAPASRH